MFARAILVALVLAGGAPRPVGHVLGFARLESAHFGVASTYDVIHCGSACRSYRPRVFVTEDARAWREITPPHLLFQLEDVEFANERVGWVVGNDCVAAKAFVYRTTDGGRSWRATPSPETNCAAGSSVDVTFLDRRHGWLLDFAATGGHDPLFRTTNGGKTWRQLTADAPGGTVVFATLRDGWIGGSWFHSPQLLFVTHDGGRTWRRRMLAPPHGWRGADVFPGVPKLFGRDGVLPVELVRGKRSAVAFYVTSDRGRTWHARAVRHVRARTVASIVSRSVWWLPDALTTDAGRSWTTTKPPSVVAAISAIDARHAWLSAHGKLYATTDGGSHWRRLPLPVR